MKFFGSFFLTLVVAGYFLFFNKPQLPANCKDCNLILITVDTLRADHLGFYGYQRNTSPFLDRFAKESIVFDNHITPRPKTGPSIASLFTGLYPNQHQIRLNREVLNANIPTLSEIFKKNNFKTAAVISNIVLKHEYSGLNRDFDIYDINVDEPELNRGENLQRNAQKTLEASVEILKDYQNDQFFLWIHLMDPHGPYLPPVEFRNYFQSTEEWPIENSKLPEYQLLPTAKIQNGLTDLNHYVDKYDDEIRYLDIQLESFFKQLSIMGLLKNSLVVFSADHGESLTEHNYYLEHGAEVYENNIRLPLAIRLPDSLEKPLDLYQGLTSSIDIFPTLTNFFQLSNLVPDGGFNLFELVANPQIKREYAFSEVFYENHFSRLAVRNKDFKVIEYENRWSCFDLGKDPKEEHAVDCFVEPFPLLKTKLAEYKNDTSSSVLKSTSAAADQKDVKTLKSLGYF